MPKVKFLRENKVVEAKEGENLRELALREGVEIYEGLSKHTNCRGKGLCATCRVLIKNGTMKNVSPQSLFEKARLGLAWSSIGEEDMRLSCQASVLGDCEVYTQPEMNLYGRKV